MISVYADFNRRVAEVHGWRFEPIENAYGDGDIGYKVFDEKGKQVYWYNSAAKCDMQIWPHYLHENSYPDFLHKVEMALELIVSGYILHVGQTGNGWYAYYSSDQEELTTDNRLAANEAKTLSEAICKSRLDLAEIIKELYT